MFLESLRYLTCVCRGPCSSGFLLITMGQRDLRVRPHPYHSWEWDPCQGSHLSGLAFPSLQIWGRGLSKDAGTWRVPHRNLSPGTWSCWVCFSVTHRRRGKTASSISSCNCSLRQPRPVWSWAGKQPLFPLLVWPLEVTEVSLSEGSLSPCRAAGADEFLMTRSPSDPSKLPEHMTFIWGLCSHHCS